MNLPKDLSGSISKNRFRLELLWGISKIIDAHKEEDDYTVIFDFKCDIELHRQDEMCFYQIKTKKEIHRFFEENPETEFILAQNISESDNPKEVHKYSLYWYLDLKTRLWIRILHKANSELFLKTGIIPHFKKNYVLNYANERLEIYQGCAQFGITRKLAEYIVRFHDQNPKFNRFFQTMYAPDESYFHTIVYNSPFVKCTPDGKAITRPHLTNFENLTYFEYPTEVTLFKEKKDWPKLRDSGFLFFRKASSESKELLDYIDEQHLLKETKGNKIK